MGIADILYPDQKKILECWNQVKSVGYQDTDIALETILASVMLGLQYGERSIVVIPDSDKRQYFSQLVSKSGLSCISLIFDTYSSVTKEEVQELQKKISAGHSETAAFEANFSRQRLHTVSGKIHEILSGFHGTEGDRTFQSVLDRMRFIRSVKHTFLLSTLPSGMLTDMDEFEFDELYDIVVKASMLYNARYYHGRKYRHYNISEKYLSTEVSIETCLQKLEHYIQEATILRDAYYQFFHDSKLQSQSALENVYRNLQRDQEEVSQMIRSLPSNSREKENEGIFKFFGLKSSPSQDIHSEYTSKFRGLEKKLKQLQDFTWPVGWPSDPADHREETLAAVISLRGHLESWYKQEKSKIATFFKSSNIYNQKEKERLAALEERFFSMVNALNDENLLDNRFEINTISLQKQAELINTLLLECTFLHTDVSENKGFYLWDSFYHAHGTEIRAVLDWLKNFHVDDWPNILEYCYLQKWIEEKTSVFASELPELMTIYKKEIQQYLNTCGIFQAQEQIAGRTEKLIETGSAYKTLHKNILQNKGIEKLNWRYFFENNGPYWGTFFDIIITNGDTFEDIHPGIFTNLFYVDHKDINTEVLHLGKTIHTYFYNRDSSDTAYDLAINAEKIHVTTKLTRPSVEILKNARALAGNFFAVRERFAIFQTKNANIISCLHPVLNMHLLSHFRDSGIKELYIDDNPAERLVECLIETKKKSFLLIQDFTLHPGDTNTLASQIRVLEDFEKMAFIIHNLESIKLTEHFQEAIQVYFDFLK